MDIRTYDAKKKAAMQPPLYQVFPQRVLGLQLTSVILRMQALLARRLPTLTRSVTAALTSRCLSGADQPPFLHHDRPLRPKQRGADILCSARE